jgi:hypothetical protein
VEEGDTRFASSSTGALLPRAAKGACVVFATLNCAECTDRSTKPHSEESLCHSTQIHDVTGELETRVKEKSPQIARVTIHPELVEER